MVQNLFFTFLADKKFFRVLNIFLPLCISVDFISQIMLFLDGQTLIQKGATKVKILDKTDK